MNFKDTLNLPRTDFPIRPNAAIDDPALIARWQADDLYTKTYYLHDGATKFILHDGPPYANGNIHLGHAYNKILKDIITKSRRMAGFHVPVIPGWDCHGLPIEIKVTQQPEYAQATPLTIKQACRTYAQGWIDVQREEFKRLGVVMHWQKPYITMDPGYEATIIKAFAQFVQQGFIERKNKTVAWCLSCKTTLASAEIEYRDRKDPSLYVRFPLDSDTVARLFPEAENRPVSLLVWTTTPWTLPLNRGVMAHPEAEYQLVDINGTLLIAGKHVASKLAGLVQAQAQVVKTFDAELLRGVRGMHPFIENFSVPIIFDHSVGLDDGTAFVHTAPGCGPIDYEVGVKNCLEIFSPVSADGKYQAGIVPVELEGMSVTDGQIWVIKKLAAVGTLWHKASLTHSYPHCWRCHNGLIFRATPQWFVDLQQHDMKKRALAAIETINFLPERAQNFLKATVENRWEWCVSRQRVWGVPIPALICRTCDKVVTTAEFMLQVADHVAQEGVEYWDRVSIDTLSALTTPCACGGKDFVKENDILDVWFDSGISHYAVLFNNPEQAFPADVYVEGVDQHRGWFQSSLLTSLVLEKTACMKAIVSHGYTVDDKGRKMSKSLGNVIAPQQIIDQIGTDGLRLWAASIGNDGDIVMSDTVLKNVAEVYRKIRNTCRFLLQNLYDFDYEKDAVQLDALLPIDAYALHRLREVNAHMHAAYDTYHTAGVFHLFADYCSSDLSSFYLDIVKDRLYVEQADGHIRRSAQTVLWHILDTLTHAMEPILSFTAELISDEYQKNKRDSIHVQTFTGVPAVVVDTAKWEQLKELRSVVLKAIEGERERGVIKHSLEAQVRITVPEFAAQFDEQFFKEFFIVSQVVITRGFELQVEARHAEGDKCPRCWNWDTVIDARGLCRRCSALVK